MTAILRSAFFRELVRVLLAIAIALTLGLIITLLVSEDPWNAYRSFLTGPMTRLNRFGDWIEESITLAFVGLAVVLVFRAQQFSLGAEGQLLLGALVSGSIALFVPLPAVMRIPLALLGAMVVGFLWGVIPGYLKAHLKANEIVSTLMLNAIALKLYDFFLTYHIKPPNAGYTASDFIGTEGRLPTFFPPIPGLESVRTLWMNQTNITIALYLLVISAVVVYFLMFRTPFGYELRMVGANLKFARYGGISTKRAIIMSMAVSGIFAGLAGAHLSMGIHNKLILNISLGLGFEGIVVALLARNNPIVVPFAALAYGYLRAGADIMERSSDMSREMVLIIQAIIILLVTAERLMPEIRRRMNQRKTGLSETIPPVGAEN
jgi:general nucleoside transport system permease protein